MNRWDSLLKTNPTPEVFESAFLRIYIEYEQFLSKTFVEFSLGRSYTTYVPVRHLSFTSENQLTELIRGEGRFVDYLKVIPRCSKHIFARDPFGTILGATNYSDDMQKMKYIRDYLAHRSSEAKVKYVNSVLGPHNIQTFLEPGDFLQRQVKGGGVTFYSKYCEIFLDVYDFFQNDALLSAI